MCIKEVVHFFFRPAKVAAEPRPLLPRRDRNDAASILAWSLREVFKHRGQSDSRISERNLLGWDIAQILSENAGTEVGATAEFIDHPMRLRWQIGYPRVHQLSTRINALGDPVITALWEIETLRAVSDLLAHLILRESNPGLLLWNTADHCKAHYGIDVYAINDAFHRSRRSSALMTTDEAEMLLRRVWPEAELRGPAGEFYKCEAKWRIHVTSGALQALALSIPVTDLRELMLSAAWLEGLQRQLENLAPEAEELRQLALYLDRFRRPVTGNGDGTALGGEIDLATFRKSLGPIGEFLSTAQAAST